MKSVCIVGGGPAGLVSAKTFFETGKFDITVYEKSSRIGGIWALDQNSTGGFLSPYTPTNLSRFTVGFSDLDWNTVDFQDHDGHTNGVQNGALDNRSPPIFPKAWMANRYLETYRKKYIPEGMILCDHEVMKVEQSGDKWNVTTRDDSSLEKTRTFDYLIMASGFFANPRSLQQDIVGLPRDIFALPARIIHSSRFRDLDGLFPQDEDVSGKKILMIGGGNSSGETAAAVALQLSNAMWSPDRSLSTQYKDYKVVHVTPRPLYALPPFNEYEDGSRSYVPLDFKLYDFAKRPRELRSYAGFQSKEVKDIVHRSLQGMVGGDQADISEALVSRKGEGRGTAYVALAESYLEYVRSGLVNVLSGRVTRIERREGDYVCATVKRGDQEVKIDDIAAVIYATGFTPHPALDMLDDVTKAALKYDSSSMRLPMVLEQWQTSVKAIPNLSLIGFYEGPYWPMMEMQARLTAERWLKKAVAKTRSYEREDELVKLRKAMQIRSLDVPQFWFNDYLGYLEDIASELDLQRNDQGFDDRQGCVSPARYIAEQASPGEANGIMKELHELWHDCTVSGKYTPRVALRALHGHWNISRSIKSAVSTFPSGTLEGTASFHPRFPTPDKSGKSFDLGYLYIEAGTFTTSTGFSMTASRRYVYRYSEAADTLSVWFVKPNNDLEVDYLFHDLKFVKPEDARAANASIAKADHLCVEDMYWTVYRLPLHGIALRAFEITHTVKGPGKDYVARTNYTRTPK